MAPMSGAERCFKCPYHANVMKVLETKSRSTVSMTVVGHQFGKVCQLYSCPYLLFALESFYSIVRSDKILLGP